METFDYIECNAKRLARIVSRSCFSGNALTKNIPQKYRLKLLCACIRLSFYDILKPDKISYSQKEKDHA